jgi:VCBS repeat protein
MVVAVGLAFGDSTPPGQAAATNADPTIPSAADQRDARLASRDAYRDETASEALATVRQKFPEFLDTAPLAWPALRAGDELKGYLNNETAIVADPSGKRGVVESTVPLRGTTPDGSRVPIDLSLVDAGNSTYTPKSAAAAVRIPDNAGGELRFPDQSFGVSLDGANRQAATVSSNKAFFANVVQDGDLVLEPRPQGAEVSLILRSPAAPTSLPLRFSLAAGQRLKLVDSSSDLPPGTVEVLDGDKRIAAVYPALAVDAQGQSVPVSYQLNGDRLVMQVDTSADVGYPLLVDPTIGVYDNNGTSVGSGTTGYTWPNWDPATQTEPPNTTTNTWSYCNNQASNPSKKYYFCQGSLTGSKTAGGPLFIKPNASLTYNDEEWAQWVHIAPADAYIYRFDAAMLNNVTVAQAQLAVGVRKADGSNWETGDVMWGNGTLGDQGDATPAGSAAYRTPTNPPTNLVNATRYLFVHDGGTYQTNPTPASAITPANKAVLRLIMSAGQPGGWNTALPYIQMGGAATWESETYAPTLTPVSHTTTPPADWVESYADTISTTATDRGLGMGTISASGPGLSARKDGCTATSGGPTGAQNLYDACAAPPPGCCLSLALPNSTYTAPQGINNYTLTATDLVGNHNPAQDQTWQVKVDNSPPVIAPLSGTLWNARGTQLADGTYTLHVDATDGSTSSLAAQRSGVASIEVFVDGNQQDAAEQSCPAGSCPLSFDWTLNAADYTGGQHTVEVMATDQLGHVASAQSFTFSRPCCMSTLSNWGGFTPGVNDVVYGDVNGDGMADAVARNTLTGDVQVSLATGSGFAPSQSWGTWSPAYDLHVADIDGDGNADLVGRNAATGDVSVSLSDGTRFASATSWGSLASNYTLSFADIDGDGAADLIGVDATTQQVVVGYSDETQFDAPVAYGSADAGYTPQFVDVDGDGAADLVEVNPSTGDVRVGISTGGATFGATTSWGTYGSNVRVLFADMNQDEAADVVVIDKTTGTTQVGLANGNSFAALTSYGSWDNAYDAQLFDINGDGSPDVVGQNALTGDIAGAIVRGPIAQGSTPPDYTPDPNIPWGDDVTSPPLQAASTNGVTDPNYTPPPRLGFMEQNWLHTKASPDAPNFDAQGHILDRLKQAGGSVVRFNALWGTIEQTPGTTPKYDFRRLDAAVHLAEQKGFQVELTITGANKDNDCTGDSPSPITHHIGCAGTDNGCYVTASGSTNDSPSNDGCFTTAYGNFVKAVVEHYTRDANNGNQPLYAAGSTDQYRFVQSFSIWNEPNQPAWLKFRGSNRLTTGLYRDIYTAGYNAYKDAISSTADHPTAVDGTQIFIGELSSRTRSGLTAPEYLRAVTGTDGNNPLIANGVAYHPYQFYVKPSMQHVTGSGQTAREARQQIGINRLDLVHQMIGSLCVWRTDSTGKHYCSGPLRTPNNLAPPLFLTEFGYLNQPKNGKPETYQDEHTRKAWFRGTAKDQGALDIALRSKVKAKWLIVYHGVERPPNPQTGAVAPWDSGLISPPTTCTNANDPSTCSYASGTADITGYRQYGKRRDGRFGFSTNPNVFKMKREAYCGIQTWAVNHHIGSASSTCTG